MDDSPIQTALCVIGHPIGGNPAQFVVLRALSALKLDWQFMSFDVEPSEIESAIRGINSLGFCGAIVASPYQNQVAKILSPSDALQTESQNEVSWSDCLYRDEENHLAVANVLSEALQDVINGHVIRTGQPLDTCVCVGELSKLTASIEPMLKNLPENRYFVVGEKLYGFSGAPPVALPETPVAVAQSEQPEAIEPVSGPTLVIWAFDSKPHKKPSSKPVAGIPSPAFLATFLVSLHPDSLVVDAVGTAAAWLHVADEHREQPLVLATPSELEVMRLALAIRRWTGREPNQDIMREAIEEYLEI
jgi:hypothetical protein